MAGGPRQELARVEVAQCSAHAPQRHQVRRQADAEMLQHRRISTNLWKAPEGFGQAEHRLSDLDVGTLRPSLRLHGLRFQRLDGPTPDAGPLHCLEGILQGISSIQMRLCGHDQRFHCRVPAPIWRQRLLLVLQLSRKLNVPCSRGLQRGCCRNPALQLCAACREQLCARQSRDLVQALPEVGLLPDRSMCPPHPAPQELDSHAVSSMDLADPTSRHRLLCAIRQEAQRHGTTVRRTVDDFGPVAQQICGPHLLDEATAASSADTSTATAAGATGASATFTRAWRAGPGCPGISVPLCLLNIFMLHVGLWRRWGRRGRRWRRWW
mmetsp:Transcript_148769/g.477808  ORF Transcript_148769/g.477808 Transcript_148769/m.477808 type:complete len:324 (+) Transcript_148769:1524-2495(+)